MRELSAKELVMVVGSNKIATALQLATVATADLTALTAVVAELATIANT